MCNDFNGRNQICDGSEPAPAALFYPRGDNGIKFEMNTNFMTVMHETGIFKGQIFIPRNKDLILQYRLVKCYALIPPYAQTMVV